MRTQVGRVLAAVVVIGAVVSGCGTDRPGSAVVIGSEVISLEQVQSKIDGFRAQSSGPAPTGDAAAQTARGIVTQAVQTGMLSSGTPGLTVSESDVDDEVLRIFLAQPPQHMNQPLNPIDELILRDVVPQAAASQGASVSPDDVDQLVAQYGLDQLLQVVGSSGVSVSEPTVETILARYRPQLLAMAGPALKIDAIRDRARGQALAVKLGQRAITGTTVTVDQVDVAQRADAEQKAKAVAAGGPAADAVFAGAQAGRGVTYSGASKPGDAGSALFGAPVGSTVVYQPDPGNSRWRVARVTAHRAGSPSGQVAGPAASRAQLRLAGLRSAESTAPEVLVNPRFGVWDPIQLRVVAADNTAGTTLAPTAR